MSETGETPKEVQEKTRREFLRDSAITFFLATGAGQLLTACGPEEPNQSEPPASEPEPSQPETDQEPKPPVEESAEETDRQEQAPQQATSGLKELYDEENMPHLDYIQTQSNEFMGLHPQDETRRQKEIAMFENLEQDNATPSDVLLALQATAHPDARYIGLDLLWKMRQKNKMEKFGFEKLSDEKIKWAEEQDIPPLMLAIAEDCFVISMELLQANIDDFLEAVPPEERQKIIDNNELANHIPNPGVMAMLLTTETSGWRNIGTETAISQVNQQEDYFPTAEVDLNGIANKFSKIIKYKNHVDTLPGSKNTEQSESGGAIGPQMMPDRVLTFAAWYDKGNNDLEHKYPPPNPFDVYTGTILAYLFLASEHFARAGRFTENGRQTMVSKEIIRPGYNVADREQMIGSLMKWNPYLPQADRALKAGIAYYNAFWAENDPRKEYAQSIKN
jgi:hypothetical protein